MSSEAVVTRMPWPSHSRTLPTKNLISSILCDATPTARCTGERTPTRAIPRRTGAEGLPTIGIRPPTILQAKITIVQPWDHLHDNIRPKSRTHRIMVRVVDHAFRTRGKSKRRLRVPSRRHVYVQARSDRHQSASCRRHADLHSTLSPSVAAYPSCPKCAGTAGMHSSSCFDQNTAPWSFDPLSAGSWRPRSS